MGSTKIKRITGLIILGCLLSTGGYAAEVTELHGVTAYAARGVLEKRRVAPNSKIIIDREQIEKFSDLTAGEVLRRLPGVTFGGPPGESKDVRLRGFDKEYTQVLIDGRRVPGGGEKREFQVDRLPADLIERIEIIRSPTADIDSQGVAGTINIILRKTQEHRVISASIGAMHLDGEGTRPHGTIVYGDQVGNFSYLFSLNGQQRLVQKDKDKDTFKTNGTLDKSEREDESKDLDKINFAPRFSWSFSEQDVFRFEPLVLFSDENKDKTKLKFKGDGSSDGSEIEDEDKARTGYAVSGAWEHGFNADSGITLGLTLQENDEDKDKVKQFFKGNGSLDKTEFEDEEKSDREILVNLTGNALVAERHALKAGLEFTDKDREKQKRKIEDKNGKITDKSGPKDNFKFDEQRVNLFILDEFAFSERHVFTPGLRMEWIRQEGTDGTGISDSDTSIEWNPSFHYLFHLSERNNFRASVARTVRRPKFDDLSPIVETKDGTLAKPDKVGNPALQPETAVGYELGIEHFFPQGAGVIGINGFYRDISDKIEKQVDINGVTGRFEEMPENVGDAKLFGVEFDASRKMDLIGLPGLTLRGNFSWLDSEVTDPKTGQKRQFKDQPDYVLNAGFDYDIAPWGLGFGLNFNRVPQVEKDEIKKDGKRTVELQNSQDRLDIYVVKHLGKAFQLRFSAENLLEVDKDKQRTIFKANGDLDKTESDIEHSQSQFLITLEGHW